MKVVGADCCSGGWFAVSIIDGVEWKTSIFLDIKTLWKNYKDTSLILIDIPIGLREKGTKERLCDIEARKLLCRKRAMSVFPVPCRGALCAQNYREACKINKRVTGRKLTLQTWNIIPRIREVDVLISKEISARSKIREIHPEVCFWAFKGEPMKYSKKTESGFNERKELLNSIYLHTNDIIKHSLYTYRRKQVKKDDILDALVAAVTATGGSDTLASIPQKPEINKEGITMEMVHLKNLIVSPEKIRKIVILR